MNVNYRCTKAKNITFLISIIILIISILLFILRNVNDNKNNYTLEYETIDIKTMGPAQIAVKQEKKDTITSTIISSNKKSSTLKEIKLEANKNAKVMNLSSTTKPIWRLPTERGYITQYASYRHIALDLTSPRGTQETIYPVANGIVTSIFHDSAGAKIVTVNHNINGQYYTSQYVHLAWFDGSIYVGKPVTTDDPLGAMGTTGISTGVHLHITVLDCNLYDPSDTNCATLNLFYNYARIRYNEGFTGLNSVMSVPYSWSSR